METQVYGPVQEFIITMMLSLALVACMIIVVTVGIVFVNSISKTIGEKGARKTKPGKGEKGSGNLNSSTAGGSDIRVRVDDRTDRKHVLKGATGVIIEEIQIREKLMSPRQVFERYPELGRKYNDELLKISREKSDD